MKTHKHTYLLIYYSLHGLKRRLFAPSINYGSASIPDPRQPYICASPDTESAAILPELGGCSVLAIKRRYSAAVKGYQLKNRVTEPLGAGDRSRTFSAAVKA